MASSTTTLLDKQLQDKLIALLTRICETPSPTFEEENRAALISSLWQAAGLETKQDDAGNVITELKGQGPTVLLAAHLDTVFPQNTDVTIKKHHSNKLAAPGIGDNSASLAVLTHYLETRANKTHPNLVVVATIGEEGVGDLKGMREVMRAYKHKVDSVIAVDGHLGTIVHQAVGSKRFHVTFHAKGGHSWGDYPSSSATHAVGDAIYAITRIGVPREPRSSLNVGQISGGTSINAIAQTASFNLDLRSLDAKILGGLEHEARNALLRISRQHDVKVDIRQIGDRPAATVNNDRLVKLAREALAPIGKPTRVAASSTDANIPMAQGIPAISFGVYNGSDAHRLSEWLEPETLVTGYHALDRLLTLLSQNN